MFRITELAKQFGLSRSTLLYYDKIRLLVPSTRSEAGYRLYSQSDKERLEAICNLRQAGLTIDDIQSVLSTEANEHGIILKRRMKELTEEIRSMQIQQQLLGQMLRVCSLPELPTTIDKRAWVEMLKAAGMDEASMRKWHFEFEKRAPEAHHDFLIALGISDEEARSIRKQSTLAF